MEAELKDAINNWMRDYRLLDEGEIARNLENMQDMLNEAHDIFYGMGHRDYGEENYEEG